MTRVLIADDHEVVRSGLRTILEAQLNCEVIAEASDGREAITQAFETKPDIAVVDYSLPLINGVEVTRQIRARLPKTEVLIFTMHDNDLLIEDLLKAGARGYVVKSEAAQHLVAAVQALANHKPYFSSKVSEVLLPTFVAKPGRPQSAPITDREREVARLVAQGHTSKEIAYVLGISDKTVETHRGAIMRKLGVSSTAAIVRYAVRNGLVGA